MGRGGALRMVRSGVLVSLFATRGVGCRPESAPYQAVNGLVEPVEHDGRRALHVVAPADKRSSDMHLLAIAPGSDFTDGTIEVDVSGSPIAGAPPDARGFIGIAFHVADGGGRFESFYLRPTNGRANDQLRRNHSTQYVSYPDFPWDKLRQSDPGVYESYADIQPGTWIRLKVVVQGTTAKLYVNRADQPALVVNDLKLGRVGGRVALWSHATTDAYFSRLVMSASPPAERDR